MATTNQKIQSHLIKQHQDKSNNVISKKQLQLLLLPKIIQAVIKEIQIADIASDLKPQVSQISKKTPRFGWFLMIKLKMKPIIKKNIQEIMYLLKLTR